MKRWRHIRVAFTRWYFQKSHDPERPPPLLQLICRILLSHEVYIFMAMHPMTWRPPVEKARKPYIVLKLFDWAFGDSVATLQSR